MKKGFEKEVKVGLVTIVGVALLIIGLSMGKNVDVAGRLVQIQMQFANSGGIKPASPVYVNGVKRGTVVKIENINDAVIVTATIENPTDIYDDAFAKIGILEVIGGKKIEIDPGTSKVGYDKSKPIMGTNSADIGDIVALLGDVSDEAVVLFRRLDTIAYAANRLLSDDQFITGIKSTVQNADELMTNANQLLRDNETSIRTSLDNIRTLTDDLKKAIDKNEPKVSELIDEIRNTVSNADSLISNANASFTDITIMIEDINKIINDIKTNESIVNRLLYDKEMAIRLDSSITNLGAFINVISQHGVNVNLRLGTRP